MRNGLRRRLRLARIVLAELSRQPLHRTELERRTITRYGTHSRFEGIFHYLRENGYVEKTAQRHRAPYGITEKGRKFLEALE